MAGTVMHLVIADRLLDQLNIENTTYFYCGNLAPDAIMARKNYSRDMKRHTHFKDDIRLHELRLPEKYAIYEERLNRFATQYVKPEDTHFEIYFGYLTHMLVDELYILEFRDKFVDECVSMGKEPFDAEYFDLFTKDVDQVDWELVRTYKFKNPMPESVVLEETYEIKNYITSEELLDSKAFIINKNFTLTHEKESLNVMTMQENLDFIELCVERIPELIRTRFPWTWKE